MRKMLVGLALISLICLMAAAPTKKDIGPAGKNDASLAIKLLLEDLPENTRVFTTKSGLQYVDIKVGEGDKAHRGQTCEVHYTGWLLDGSKFDSSKDRNKPFEFPLGMRRVIRGWDEGVEGMTVGGVRRLAIPPELGYGQRPVGPIPAGSTLIFEVELLGVSGRALDTDD